jgi:hypothetical protein
VTARRLLSLRSPVLASSLLLGWLAAPVLAQQSDVTLENAEQLLRRAFSQVGDTPVAQSADAGPIIAALRSSKDKDLLPLFERMQKSTVPENQIYGMIAAIVVTKDPKRLDLPLLLGVRDPILAESAIATLIDTEQISTDQLLQVATNTNDATLKAMAVGELDHRHALKDRSMLLSLLDSEKNVVRFYAAITILQGPDTANDAAALKVLHDMTAEHDPRLAVVEAMMLVRVQKETITRAWPWVVQIAADDSEENDQGLRYTAVTTALALKRPEGVHVLEEMIQKDREVIDQVKLGLISLEFAAQLKPSMVEPIVRSRSGLVSTIGTLAQQAADGVDITGGLVKLIKEGHPIVLDWALVYSDRADADRKLDILAAIVNQATIVDDVRGRDYERAALAAQKLMENCGKDGRAMVESLLKSQNRAVVEAVLAGVYRSTSPDQSAIVLPIWPTLKSSSASQMAANYAALILAREGNKEAIPWLGAMVLGGTVQNQGLRGLAGWYYVKLQGAGDAVVKMILAQ